MNIYGHQLPFEPFLQNSSFHRLKCWYCSVALLLFTSKEPLEKIQLAQLLLVVGCWLLVVGCWLLVVGCWLLVVVVVVVAVVCRLLLF